MEEYLVNFEKIKRLMFGFSAFQVLVAGCKLDLFETLAQHPGIDQRELATLLGISQRSARVLLLACCTYELVIRKDGCYYNSGISDQFLTKRSNFPFTGLIRYCDVVQYKAFQLLTESLRSERNEGLQTIPGSGDSLYQRLAQSPELEQIFVEALAPKDRVSRQLLCEATEFCGVRHLLDVGGGPGPVAGLLKKEYPHLKITLFELPSICERANSHFKENQLNDLIVHPGDFFTDEFPTGMDGILFSYLLGIFSEEKNILLLKKAFDALPDGGQIFIHQVACDDSESGADLAAWGSLYFLVLASGEGMMYPVHDYRRWLKEVGFSSITEKRNEFENMLVTARK